MERKRGSIDIKVSKNDRIEIIKGKKERKKKVQNISRNYYYFF